MATEKVIFFKDNNEGIQQDAGTKANNTVSFFNDSLAVESAYAKIQAEKEALSLSEAKRDPFNVTEHSSVDSFNKEIEDLNQKIKQRKEEVRINDGAVQVLFDKDLGELKAQKTFLERERDVFSSQETVKEKYDGYMSLPKYTATKAGPNNEAGLIGQLSGGEWKMYNFLLNEFGKQKANEYVDDMRPILNMRKSQQLQSAVAEVAEEYPVISSVATFGYNLLDGVVGFPAKFIGNLTGDYQDNWAAYDTLSNLSGTIRQTVSDNKSDVGGFAYNVFMSIGDMATAILFTKGLGAAAGAAGLTNAAQTTKIVSGLTQVVMSSEAASQTMTAARERGLDNFQIAGLGLAAFAAEAITEKYSIEALFDTSTTGFKYLLKNAITEGVEEGASNVLNTVADLIIAGDEAETKLQIIELMKSGEEYRDAVYQTFMNKMREIGTDMLAGALSGSIVGSGGLFLNKLTKVQVSLPSKAIADISSAKQLVLEKLNLQNNVVSVRGLGTVRVHLQSLQKAVQNTKTVDQATALLATNDILRKGTIFEGKDGGRAVVATPAYLNGNIHSVTVSTQKIGENSWVVNGVTVDGDLVYDSSAYVSETSAPTASVNEDMQSTAQENPQQSAGTDNAAGAYPSVKPQTRNGVRDRGVEIGVIPSEMDTAFKRMDAVQRQQLYTSLEQQTGAHIVEDETLAADGEYDPKTKTIRINPNRATPITVLKHEFTHFIESNAFVYQDFMNYVFESDAFNQWLISKGQSHEDMRKELVKRYAAQGVQLDPKNGSSADQEILANFVAEKLFTDFTALQEMARKKPTLFERIKNWFTGIIQKFRGTPAETELQHMERMFSEAMQGGLAINDGEIKYSIGLSFAEQLQQILDGTFDKEHSHLFVRSNTPAVYTNLEKVNIPDLPIVMSYDNAVVSLFDKNNDTKSDHNHGLGKEMMSNLPQIIEDPLYVVLLPSGRINAILEATDKKGRHYFISMELEVQKPVAEIYSGGYKGKQHLLLTVFGAQKGYVRNILEDPKNIIVYDKNKNPDPRGNPEGKGLNIINGSESFDTIVSETSPSVKQYSMQDTPKKFIAPDATTEPVDLSAYTDEQLAEEMVRRSRNLNPLEIAMLTPEDANTTPPLHKNGQMNTTGDGESAFAQSVQESGIFSEELKKLSAEDENITRYDIIQNDETMARANDRINEGGREFVERFSYKDPSAYTVDDMATAMILISRYDKVGDYEAATALMEKLRKAGTYHGQAVQILSLLSRLSPDGMVVYAQKELSEAFKIMAESRSKKWAEQNQDRFNLTDADVDFIRRLTWQAAQLPKGRDKNVRLAQIAEHIQSKIPPEKGQAYKALQRTAMLLNPKTQIRNVVGNLGAVPLFWGSDLVGTAIDKAIAKKTGMRTKSFTLKGSAEGFKKGLFETYDDFIRHISTRDINADRFDISSRGSENFNTGHTGFAAKQRNALSRALNALDRFNSFLLETGDRPFYEMWFINSLNGQMKANNVTEPTGEMIELAILEAEERTWQDTNKMTKMLSKLKSALNTYMVGGYGLGDVIVKFVKTPANLTKAMLEFSPAGFAKAITLDAKRFATAVKEGRATPQMQRMFVKNLSNGIVGSLLTAIAAGMAKAGWVTGEQDEDKDVASFERNILGRQPYSFKIGNTYLSYDWAQPMSATIALMANYFEEKENAELTGEKKQAYEAIWDALSVGGQVLYNQSFMQSIYNFFSSDDPFEGVINAILSDVNAPIPQLSSQVASTLDPVARNTYEPGNRTLTAVNKVLYKIPGARNHLAPSVDALGNDRKQNENSVARAALSFLSPFDVAVGYDTAAGKEMYRLYESTGDAAAIAPTAPNYVSTANGKYTLSSRQKAEYQKVMGEIATNAVEGLLQINAYNTLTDEQRVEILASVYTYSRQAANKKVLDVPMNESAVKVEKAINGGVPVEFYYLMKKTASADGNDNVSQKEARAVLDSSELTAEQKSVMWQAFNSSWKNNPYRTGGYKYY